MSKLKYEDTAVGRSPELVPDHQDRMRLYYILCQLLPAWGCSHYLKVLETRYRLVFMEFPPAKDVNLMMLKMVAEGERPFLREMSVHWPTPVTMEIWVDICKTGADDISLEKPEEVTLYRSVEAFEQMLKEVDIREMPDNWEKVVPKMIRLNQVVHNQEEHMPLRTTSWTVHPAKRMYTLSFHNMREFDYLLLKQLSKEAFLQGVYACPQYRETLKVRFADTDGDQWPPMNFVRTLDVVGEEKKRTSEETNGSAKRARV